METGERLRNVRTFAEALERIRADDSVEEEEEEEDEERQDGVAADWRSLPQ